MRTKDKIIAKINSIEDEKLLEDIMRLIELESDFNTVYAVSEEQQSNIEEGLADIEKGRTYSQDQANEIIREWLKKK